MMNKDSKILIVGHNDIIENSLFEHFKNNGFSNVFSSTQISLNPTIQPSVYEFFQKYRPEYVFLASTRSGGIEANIKYAAEFIYHNLESQNNIIYCAWKFGTKKLIYYAGSCIYPKESKQPIKEESLLTGELEKTSESYSIAKIAGVKLCEAFKKQYGLNSIVAIPATIYGPGSDVDLEKAHVIGALLAKFASAVKTGAKEVVVWGTGEPRREFLFVDDFIDASLFLMENYNDTQMINVGAGTDVSIKELAELIAEVTGYKGSIKYDSSKPNGTMRKLTDTTRLTKLGWKPKVGLREGIKKTYDWYLSQTASHV
jgi:GDP-L-fucose synthase